MTRSSFHQWCGLLAAAAWLAPERMTGAGLSPETTALVESFSGQIAVLPGLPGEDWAATPAGRELAAAGLKPHLTALSAQELVDTNLFTARRFAAAIYLGGEAYLHTVRRTGDGEEALRQFLAGGGRLLVLPSGPFPFYYNQATQPVNSAAKLGLNLGAHGFERPPGAVMFHAATQQNLVRFPERAWPFPSAAEADQRWRSITGVSSESARYTPLATLRTSAGQSLGDGAAWVEALQGPLRGSRVFYAWFSLLADAGVRAALLDGALKHGLEGKEPPPATLACRRTQHAPVIDGSLDEGVWQDAPGSAPFKSGGLAARPSPRRSVVQARWDNRALYLAWRWDGAAVGGKGETDLVRGWLARAGAGQSPLQFTVRPNGPSGPEGAGLMPAAGSNVFRCAVTNRAGWWTAEAAIPWSLMGTSAPPLGTEWRGQFARMGAAAGGGGTNADWWSPTDQAENAARFGFLRLAADPLSDDFEQRREVTGGGADWRLEGGTWKLDHGALVGQDCVANLYEIKGAGRGSRAWHDYTFTARFRVEARGSDWRDGPWFGLHCRPEGDGYYLTFTDRDCQLHKVIYGTSTSDANCLARAPWKSDQEWHTLKVTLKDNWIQAALDNRALFEVKDDSHLFLPSLRSGGIVLAARKASASQGSTVVRFDDVEVRLAGGPLPCPPGLPAVSERTPAQPRSNENQAAALESARLYQALAGAPDAAKALALAERGESALPQLKRGLESGGRLAALCAWALWQRPVAGTDLALRGLLWQVDQVAGYWAAHALGRSPTPENSAALAALLPDERLGFWELSANGAGRLTDVFGRGVRQWATAEDWMPNIRVAYAAMESLGEMESEPARATLLRGLQNDQYLIRQGAARGLGRLFQRRAGPLPEGFSSTAGGKLAELAERDPVLIVRLAARQAIALLNAAPATNEVSLLAASSVWIPRGSSQGERGEAAPELPAIAFIKTPHRSESNLGFRDSYFFPKTPRYHSGENLYTLTPPRPDGVLRNLTQLSRGEVQGPEVSPDGKRILFAMRRDRERDGFHIFEINADGSGLRQLSEGNCNDADPCYLPDGRIGFCSDRAGYQEYYHQERSRVIYAMNADGSGIEQLTFNPNQDYEPLALRDGRVLYGSYRFYAQDGSEGPLRGEWMGLARIETVLRAANPDGSADQLFYGSMRGSFYAPMRAMPFSDQFAGWHRRGYHVGVSISQARELPDGRIVCTSPAGLTVLDTARLPTDCEAPIHPEILNLAGGEEVYIYNYDEMNPVGRYTTPHPAGGSWILVSHAPWHDPRVNGYALYLMNVQTRELRLVYDDPTMADVDPVPLTPRAQGMVRESTLAKGRETGLIYCNSVFNSDAPFDRAAVRYVRVLEGVLMGESIAANAAFRTRELGITPVHPDGSFYVEVPADVPLRFELVDEDGRMLVHETEFNYVRPGETKGCMGCHESRKQASANTRPQAMGEPPVKTLRQRGDLIYMGKPDHPYNQIHRN